MINEALGWLGIALGILGGAGLGLGYDQEGWMGGYGSLRRRLLRLGHIALIALGFLNILFAHSVARIGLEARPLSIASWCLAIGAFAMPACCFLNAWRNSFKNLFAVPVVLLATGCAMVFYGLVTS
jgi:hypothetical protein